MPDARAYRTFGSLPSATNRTTPIAHSAPMRDAATYGDPCLGCTLPSALGTTPSVPREYMYRAVTLWMDSIDARIEVISRTVTTSTTVLPTSAVSASVNIPPVLAVAAD